MQSLSTLQQLSIIILPVILGITVHEAAHAWAANKLGDPTARQLGRLSLNPIRHIDPIGTLLVPAVLFLFSGMLFGWAKPVPVNWSRLHEPKRDSALVAAAGPFSNLIMAVLWALVIQFAMTVGDNSPWIAIPLAYMGYAGVMINSILLVLNLLPIPPLDGSRVVASFLPEQLLRPYMQLERWGLLILIALLATGMLSKIMLPLVSFVQSLVARVTGL
ncbi:MAG TPA: site-2 protease family protein [Gammaproteobacteria bacterium]|nr:site-2 protease family protein [Gammaproteobacteria bacterium]